MYRITTLDGLSQELTTEIDERLLKRERQFRSFQIWPLSKRLDIRRWLGNFNQEEQQVATWLASRFTFFAEEPTNALFASSVQRLFNSKRTSAATAGSPLTNVAFVAVEGENPNASDSGNLFARKARDLGVSEDCILRPHEALSQSQRFRAFVFIDDFVGSGNQMGDTWERIYPITGSPTSFKQMASNPAFADRYFAYCACICTQAGMTNLIARAPKLHISAAHVVNNEWNLASNYSGGNDILAFLEETGRRAGYTADDGGEDDWLGFHQLGLGLAFNHGVPDATLPIFRSIRNGWQPLVSYP